MRHLIILVVLAVAVATGPQLAAANYLIQPVLTWNDMALDTVRTERLGAFGAARLYAMVNVAMYDAVNGINVANGWTDREEALVSSDTAPSYVSRRAAAMAAAHAVLSALHPNLSGLYDPQLAADLANLLGTPTFIEGGRQWGESVGQQVVALRANDGSSPSETQPGGSGPGEFRADWGSAQYRNMTPFAINDPVDYFSAGPPALSSTEYADALNEVKTLGNAAIPDTNKEEIFRFWRGGGGSARPPGEWIKVAMTVASNHSYTKFFLSRTVRLFALLGMALGDSAVTSADSKFAYHFWRPTTAIQNADTDGNAATVADPTWAPRNGSIGGSPEHTSGQSTFAGAGSTILAGFFDDDTIAFTFEGDDAIAGPRTFSSFSAAAAEAGRARIFAGIHYEFSNQAGQMAGRDLAAEILSTQLLSPSHDDYEDDEEDDS
ncbi:MAG: hypothetical protein ETSY1_19615 [Candidatus Entotheonella factor]|uniref:Uncharacterized protein n=1 Tax=Entotheonella factor TaxID=1429438 RepID=W4LJY0_ENTF1|nr:vanadium-dependent haloperoxidase [Candidatus Entotheonella palauensis]ETW98224.1 MAG: hypothetical protein ETSY1_19615 [Candidatus Entotheonella factor]